MKNRLNLNSGTNFEAMHLLALLEDYKTEAYD
jgi:hypothetical protein